MNNRFIKILVTFLLVVFTINSNAQTRYKSVNVKKDSLGTVSSRISFSTNFIDWALYTPNIGLEYDLGNQNMIGAQSIFLNFKYRYDLNYQNNIADLVNIGTNYPSNYWSGKIEYRWHYRWNENRSQRKGLIIPALWFQNLFVSKKQSKEATTRAMQSSSLQRPSMIRGRSYIGLFAEYMDFTLRSKLDIIERDKVKDGYALIGGVSFGHEFPSYFHNNHYWEFILGANIGAVFTSYNAYSLNEKIAKFEYSDKKILPMLTELKFGMSYRKESVSRKYWKASNKIALQNMEANRKMQILIDSITDNYSTSTNIIINVPKANSDFIIKTPVEKNEIIREIRRQTKMPLVSANFINDTIFPIKKLDEYTITYRFNKAIDKYNDELEEHTDVVLRFRVDLVGRKEAEETKQTFIDAVQKYRDENGIPVLYAEAKSRSNDRNEIEGYIPMEEVLALFSHIWGRNITPDQLTGVSQRLGAGIVRPVEQINRRSRYTINLLFHPQVALNYETDPVISQFEVQFRDESSGLAMYNSINGHRITFQRKWEGSDTFSPEITAKEIAEALNNDGLNVTEDMVEVNTSQNKFYQRYSAAIYLPAAYVANITFIVEDKDGAEKAQKDMDELINPWIQSRKWPELVFTGPEQNPEELDITEEDIIEAFRNASGYEFNRGHFLSFDTEEEYQKMVDGRYRTFVRIQIHPEFKSQLRIPYYIRFAK